MMYLWKALSSLMLPITILIARVESLMCQGRIICMGPYGPTRTTKSFKVDIYWMYHKRFSSLHVLQAVCKCSLRSKRMKGRGEVGRGSRSLFSPLPSPLLPPTLLSLSYLFSNTGFLIAAVSLVPSIIPCPPPLTSCPYLICLAI